MHWNCKRSGGRFRSLKADYTDFICESEKSVYVSDYEKQCLYGLNHRKQSLMPVIELYSRERQGRGPLKKVLSYPAGIVARGIVIYIAEHPSLYQGAIRMSYLLKGLVKL